MMIYVIFGTDKTGMLALREKIRPEHRRYLRQRHKVTVIQGGPTLCDRDLSMNGSLIVVESETLAQVTEFIERDPYSQAGLFESVDIRPWKSVPIIRGEKI